MRPTSVSGPVIIQLASNFSDGDEKNWPKEPYYLAAADMGYQDALAKRVASQDPTLSRDAFYQLENLPAGYAVFCKIGKDERLDRYLYGHRNGRFDSYLKFWVHFEWLMNGGVGQCLCVRCHDRGSQRTSSSTNNSSSSRRITMTSTASTMSGGAPSGMAFQDDARLRNDLVPVSSSRAQRSSTDKSQQRSRELLQQRPHLFHGLHPMQQFSRMVAESTDNPENPTEIRVPWSYFTQDISQALLSELDKIKTKASFEPRCGEVVLYSRVTSDYRIQSELQTLEVPDSTSASLSQGGSRLMTEWHVGIVAAVPNHPAKLDDLTSSADARPRQMFYRIDGLHNTRHRNPDVRTATEDVTLAQIRPFHLFHELQAMNVVQPYCRSFGYGYETTLCINFLKPYECIGRGNISLSLVRGIYIGTELIIQGDVVRVFSANNGHVIQRIIVVEEIHVVYSANLNTRSALVGREYLTVQTAHTRSQPLDESTEAHHFGPGMHGYTWYPVVYSEGQTRGRASFNHVVGRLVSKSAIIAMLGTDSVDVGSGIAKVRDHARENLAGQRRHEPRFEGFYIKECRYEALGVTHINASQIDGNNNNVLFTEGMNLAAVAEELPGDNDEELYDHLWDLDVHQRDD